VWHDYCFVYVGKDIQKESLMTKLFKQAAIAAASVAMLAAVPANAVTYIITISDGALSQTDTVAPTFTPKFGYTGGPVQSWGFGTSNISIGGWLDFYQGGTTIQNEASTSAGGVFTSALPFFTLGSDNLLSFSVANGSTETFALTDGGSLSISAVPEPATWAMMLLGFGMIGMATRARRKSNVRVTYA
jgi:hypothetical protein